jgi:hypothetical protein
VSDGTQWTWYEVEQLNGIVPVLSFDVPNETRNAALTAALIVLLTIAYSGR